MPESLHQRIDRDRKAGVPDAASIRDYRAYAQGDQRSTLGPVQKRALGQVAVHPFADNVCDLVCNALAARAELLGFAVESEGVAAFLADLYVKNQLADLSYDAHYAVARDGTAAVMLRWLADDRREDPDPDALPTPEAEAPQRRAPGRVTLHLEDWWDGKTGVYVHLDEANLPAYAVKDFTQLLGDPPAEHERRTVYFPDRIERYVKRGDGWQPFPLDGEPETGIVPWLKADGSPLGIPVVAVRNPRFGRQRVGASDIAGGLLSLQDQINDVQWDVTAAARLTGYQMYFAKGIKPERNADGTVKRLAVGPGMVVEADGEHADMKVLPAGDMSQLLAAHGLKIQTVARNTSTPLHIITGGDWPSGMALVQAEKPIVTKAQRFIKSAGPGWATVAHRATELANAFGGAGLDDAALVTATFAPPERFDPMAEAEAEEAKAKALLAVEALQDRRSLVRMGLTEDEADEVLAAREQRQAARDELIAGFGGGDEDEE